MAKDSETKKTHYAKLHVYTTILGAIGPQQQSIIKAAVQRCAGAVTGAPKGESSVTIDIVDADLPAGRNADSKISDHWPNSSLPRKSVLRLSRAELPALETNGLLGDILTHEILHCLGFGLLWRKFGHVAVGSPIYTGPLATAEYKALLVKAGKNSAVAGIPVESGGAAGQASIHWSKSVFGTELMSTAEPDPGNLFSTMTIAAMADLGYQVDPSKADSYRLP